MEQMHDIDKRLTVVETRQDSLEKRVEAIDIKQGENQDSLQELLILLKEFISQQKKTNEFMETNLKKQEEGLKDLQEENKKLNSKWSGHYKWVLGSAITIILALVGYLMKVILK